MANTPAADCIFCKLINKQIPSTPVYEDADAVVLRDINPQAPHHLLVLPRVHVRDLPALIAHGDARLPGHLLTVANQVAAQEGLVEQGFRLVINTGANAGQSVFHLHVHVLGGRGFGWPPG